MTEVGLLGRYGKNCAETCHIIYIRFIVNVWAGITGDLLMGPYESPPRLSGASYLHFLTAKLPQLLKDVLLTERQTVWFMYD
jgi:hypothetical protein